MKKLIKKFPKSLYFLVAFLPLISQIPWFLKHAVYWRMGTHSLRLIIILFLGFLLSSFIFRKFVKNDLDIKLKIWWPFWLLQFLLLFSFKMVFFSFTENFLFFDYIQCSVSLFIKTLMQIIFIFVSFKIIFKNDSIKSMGGFIEKFLLLFIYLCLYLDFYSYKLYSKHLLVELDSLSQGGFLGFLDTIKATGMSLSSFFTILAILFISSTIWYFCIYCLEKFLLLFKVVRIKYFLKLEIFLIFFLIADFNIQKIREKPFLRKQIEQIFPLPINLKPLPLGIASFIVDYKQPLIPPIDPNDFKSNKPLPLVFFVFVESLRADAFNSEDMPFMWKRKNDFLSSAPGLSNSHSTHFGWFSTLRSQFAAHYWGLKSFEPSLPLRILKEMGYTFHLYSQLDMIQYLRLGDFIFGENSTLLSSKNIITKSNISSENDPDVLNKCLSDLKNSNVPRFSIIGLDSTHYEYNYPAEFLIKKPAYKNINFLKSFYEPNEIKFFKNNYDNSVRYVDTILEDFLKNLQKMGLYEDSIIIILGDHGEEFYESQNWIHSSQLNEWQTTITMLIKFGKNNFQKPTVQVSQVDLLPSVLDFLGINEKYFLSLNGESFRRKKSEQNFLSSSEAVFLKTDKYSFKFSTKPCVNLINCELNLLEIIDQNKSADVTAPNYLEYLNFIKNNIYENLEKYFLKIKPLH